MNNGKAVIGLALFVLFTAAFIGIIFGDTPVESEANLLKASGLLSIHDCRKGRYIEAIRLNSDSNHYYLELRPKLLPSCDTAKKEWPKGSEIVLYHTANGFKSDIYAYKLSVNGMQIYGYQDAIESIKARNRLGLGFIAFIWTVYGGIGVSWLIKHNKQRQSDA